MSGCVCVDMIIVCTSVLARFSFIAMEAGNDVEMVGYWKNKGDGTKPIFTGTMFP